MSKSHGRATGPAFEVTAFGRRRVSRVPRLLRAPWRVVRWPVAFVFRKLRVRPGATAHGKPARAVPARRK